MIFKKPKIAKAQYRIARFRKLINPGYGAIAAWTFEDQVGSVLKDVVGNHNGVLKNMENTDWKPSGIDELGRCLDFDGSNEYVEIPDSNDFSFGNGAVDSPFSVSAWIYMDSAANFSIISKYGTDNREYYMTTAATGKLEIGFYSFDGTKTIGRRYNTALSTGQWYHIVMTYDGRGGANAEDGIKLYVGGARKDDTDIKSGTYVAMDNGTSPVWIGRSAVGYANGKIAQVMIYDYELSAAEVFELYEHYGKLRRWKFARIRIPAEIDKEKAIKKVLAK